MTEDGQLVVVGWVIIIVCVAVFWMFMMMVQGVPSYREVVPLLDTCQERWYTVNATWEETGSTITLICKE